MRHLLGIGAVTAIILLCTFLPFLPGRYDALAVPLSTMAQVFGIVGLLLVPIGALWLAAERVPRLAGWRFALGLLAFLALSFVSALIAAAAAVQGGFALGVITIALGGFGAPRVWPHFKRPRGGAPEASTAVPLYLIVIPVVVALVHQTVVERAIAFSRARAIRNSAPLITAIERNRAMNGQYPESLLSVNPDYWPNVIGIPKYHYERHGDAYNLFFEQFSYRLGNREFVLYNPRDQHVMTSHAADILELTPEQLALDRTRGHNALHEGPSPHWKYFWFD